MNHDKPFIIGITDMSFRDTCWQEGQLIYISLNGVNDARDLINQGLLSDNQSFFCRLSSFTLFLSRSEGTLKTTGAQLSLRDPLGFSIIYIDIHISLAITCKKFPPMTETQYPEPVTFSNPDSFRITRQYWSKGRLILGKCLLLIWS